MRCSNRDFGCRLVLLRAAVYVSFSLTQIIRRDRSAHTAAELHRSSYRDGAAFRALALPDQIVVPQALAIGRGEHGIDPPALFGVAAIIAPCGSDILVKVLLANPMMDTVNLPFEQRPEA